MKRSNIPWTRGEKWLAVSVVAGLAIAVGSWAWMNDLDRMPVVKLPTHAVPYPTGYS